MSLFGPTVHHYTPRDSSGDSRTARLCRLGRRVIQAARQRPSLGIRYSIIALVLCAGLWAFAGSFGGALRRVVVGEGAGNGDLQHDDAVVIIPDPAHHEDHYHQNGGGGEGPHQHHAADVIDKRAAIRLKFAGNVVQLQNALLETCPISKLLAQSHWATCRIMTSRDAVGKVQGWGVAAFESAVASDNRARREVSDGFLTSEANTIVAKLSATRGLTGHVTRALALAGGRTEGHLVAVPPVERLWEECSWDSMAPMHRVLWSHYLGYDAHAWDVEQHSVVPSHASDVRFASLRYDLQLAVMCLGYDAQTW